MEELREEVDVKENFRRKLAKSRLKWVGHVQRMEGERRKKVDLCAQRRVYTWRDIDLQEPRQSHQRVELEIRDEVEQIERCQRQQVQLKHRKSML